MTKYIIKNCPCLYRGYRSDYECDSKGELCEEVTNCLLKQIVEKCKISHYPVIDKQDFKLIGFTESPLAKEILSMLEIQELEWDYLNT